MGKFGGFNELWTWGERATVHLRLPPLLYMGAHTSIIPEPSAGRACPQLSPREGSRCLPSLLAGLHRTSHTYVFCRSGLFTLTWASGKRSPESRNTVDFILGVWSCATGAASEERGKERVCSNQATSVRVMMVRLHNIPLLQRKIHSIFATVIQCAKHNSTTVNIKLTTMIRNIYGYKTYNHAVFTGFFAGVYLSSQMFYFANSRHGPFVQTIFIHFLSRWIPMYVVRATERVPAGSCHFPCFTDPSQSVVSSLCIWKWERI